MSIFMFGKKKTEESSISQENLQKILKDDASKYLITSVPQSEIKTLTTSREIKHLKKQIWKFSRRY